MTTEAMIAHPAREVQGAAHSTTPWVVTWLTWPALFLASIGGSLHAISNQYSYEKTYPVFLFSSIIVLMALESAFPLQQRWKMTWRSMLRDVKYLVTGSAFLAVINGAFGLISIRLGDGHIGPITGWPLYLSVPAALLAVDFLQYWQHRWEHTLGGRLGSFLWGAHAAHHLPDRVYIFMHAVGHPVNLIIVRAVIMIPALYFLGATAETILLFNVINNLQGLVSHCNIDLRAGWFNYVFTGAELHRFHHSAAAEESRNYAVTLPLFDIVFGTFYYRPGQVPDRLGVENPAVYPDSNEFWKVMRMPFQRQ